MKQGEIWYTNLNPVEGGEQADFNQANFQQISKKEQGHRSQCAHVTEKL